MNNLLLSTGCYSRVMKDANNMILRALRHEVTGVELSFLTIDEIMNYTPSLEVIERLKDKYNTIHAPSKVIEYSNNESSINILDKVRSLYKTLNCKNAVFHYDTIKDAKFLSDYLLGVSLSVENGSKDSAFSSIKEINSFLKDNTNFSLTLDVCHCLEFSKEYLRVVSKSKRISEVHWSYSGHSLNHDSASAIISDIVFGLDVVKKLDKPTVIEVDLRPDMENNKVIASEIRLLKNGL